MKIAIYTRVSTEDQVREGYSLQVQKEYLEEFAKREGLEIYKFYCDEGISAYSTCRPALQDLIADAKAKRFEMVLAYKLDRFSRNLKDLLNLVDQLSGYGVAFKSATEPFDTSTSAGRLMFQQLGSFAEFERNRIAERVFPGMVKAVQQGKIMGGKFASYGYRYDRLKQLLYIHPEEAKLVKLIYSMYLEGRSTRDIMEYLNKKGIKSRTGIRFYSKFIGDVLKNPIYIGKIIWNRCHYDKNQKTKKGYRYIKNSADKVITAQGKHEHIISEEDFNKVQAILAEKKRGWRKRVAASPYLMARLLFCSKCNSPYFGSLAISNHRTNAKKRWYRCGGPVHHSINCKNRAIKADEAEAVIDGVVADLVKNKRLATYQQMSVTGSNRRFEPFSGPDILKARKQFAENMAKQSKLTDAYLDNLLGEDVYRGKMDELRVQEDECKKLVAGIELMQSGYERSQGYLNRVKDFLDGYDDGITEVDFVLKKQMVGLLFQNIKIAPPVGAARPEKRLSYALFEPFQQLFSEARAEKLCRKNQYKIKNHLEESTSRLSDAR